MDQNWYFNEVDRAYQTLRGAELENRLKELVEQSRAEYGESNPFYAAVLSELGGYYRGQGRGEESEACLVTAVEIFGEQLGKKNPNYATALNNLAGTHRLMGKLDEAEKEFEVCLEIYRDTVGEGHILFASGLNNLSLVAMERGDLERAETLQHTCSEILAQYPECLDELATSLCNLGTLKRKNGKLEEAKTDLLRAIGLYETELGTVTPHYHAALNTLGLTYYSEGDCPQACQWLEQSVAAAEKLYGPEHGETRAAKEHLRLVRAAWEENT